jgi:hypothetical protein
LRRTALIRFDNAYAMAYINEKIFEVKHAYFISNRGAN